MKSPRKKKIPLSSSFSLPGRAGRALEGCPRSLFCVYRTWRPERLSYLPPGHTASGRIATKILAPTPQILPPFHTRISHDGIPWPRNLSKTLGRSGDIERKIMSPWGREGKLRHHKTEALAVSQRVVRDLGCPLLTHTDVITTIKKHCRAKWLSTSSTSSQFPPASAVLALSVGLLRSVRGGLSYKFEICLLTIGQVIDIQVQLI